MSSFYCPHCGGEVPSHKQACPHCGSDVDTGWGDRAYTGDVNLPPSGKDADEEYLDFLEREHFGSENRSPLEGRRGLPAWVIWTAIITAAMLFWMAMHGWW